MLMIEFNIYFIIIGGNDGKVTPATKPWQMRIPKLIHKLSFEAMGKRSDKIEHTNAESPSTSFVPNFSAKVPPKI